MPFCGSLSSSGRETLTFLFSSRLRSGGTPSTTSKLSTSCAQKNNIARVNVTITAVERILESYCLLIEIVTIMFSSSCAQFYIRVVAPQMVLSSFDKIIWNVLPFVANGNKKINNGNLRGNLSGV